MSKYRKEQAIIATLIGGGLRRSEVTKLRLCDVFETFLFLRETKTKKDYKQEVNLQLMPIIQAYKELRIKQEAKLSDSLFQVSDRTIARIVKRHADRVGIDHHVSPHSLRATFATIQLDLGVSVDKVARNMRHNSIQSTMRYDKRRLQGMDNPVNLMDFTENSKKDLQNSNNLVKHTQGLENDR